MRPIVIDSGMMPPLLHAAQHLAAVIEQAGDAGALDAVEIVEHRVLAFRREQIGQIALHEFVAVIAEQRFGAAVAGIDVALGVEHHDAFGRGVEDGAEFFGIGVADRRRFGERRLGDGRRLRDRGGDGRALVARAREDQRQRGIAVPGDRVEARVGRRRSAHASRRGWLAEIVTGVPVSDVLLAFETPGST